MRFRDRADAGRQLARLLLPYRGHETRVFGLNSGGIRVGYEVAHTLGVSLELWAARGVEALGRAGARLGAVSEGEGFFLDAQAVRSTSAPAGELARWMEAEAGEVTLEARRLRGGHPRLEAGTATALLVVEGIAAGDFLAYAALRGLRRQHPRHLVLAAPVAAAEELERLRLEADKVLCLHPVGMLLAVEHAYEDFREVPDLVVRQVLERARELRAGREALVPGKGSEWL